MVIPALVIPAEVINFLVFVTQPFIISLPRLVLLFLKVKAISSPIK